MLRLWKLRSRQPQTRFVWEWEMSCLQAENSRRVTLMPMVFKISEVAVFLYFLLITAKSLS